MTPKEGLPHSLAAAAQRMRLRVCAVELPEDDRLWLAAVGLEAGEELSILRAAPLGDPLHVRMQSGAEFALARSLAGAIQVEPIDG